MVSTARSVLPGCFCSVPAIVIPSEARNLHLAIRYTVSVLGLANAPDICYNTRRLAS